MFLRVLSYIYIFLIRLRFPSEESVANVIRKRYGGEVLSKTRKFEKQDFRRRKVQLDITFIEACLDNNLFPNFVGFRTANRRLKKSETYDSCQRILLQEELKIKTDMLADHNRQFSELKKYLYSNLSSLDYLFITSLFLERNARVSNEIELSQNVKLSKLIAGSPKHSKDNLIFNYSSHLLTPAQESILMKGLNYALPPKKLKYEDYLLDFELLMRSVNSSSCCKDSEVDNFKTKLRDIGHSSLSFYNSKKRKLENITEEEHNAIKELASLEDIIIQKADKGNVIVILDRTTYVERIEALLSDTSKFTPISFTKENDDLKYILERESDINQFLAKLVTNGVLTAEQKQQLSPCGSSPGILYGVCKVHKIVPEGVVPPFRPILSAINTPSYKLAKYLVPILAPLTTNKYVTKDSFQFAQTIITQNSEYYMTSYDVDALFTNIPLDETIEICIKRLYGRKRKFKGFSRQEFRELLQFAVKDSMFIFNGNYYIQCDGVAMGSPLGPTLANIFLCHMEEKWLQKCPKQFSPVFYNRYVDDTFTLFTSIDHVKKFHRYLNSRHPNITFTYEEENNNCLPFLDVLVTREENKFSTSIYRKPTFSGLYTNFNSFIPDQFKKGLILTLLFRMFKFIPDWHLFHQEVKSLTEIFRKNAYPEHFIDKCVGIFLEKQFVKTTPDQTAPKTEHKISLPYMGKYSNDVKKQLLKLASNCLKDSKITILWNSPRRLRQIFHFKDRLPMRLRSHILYQYSCDGCNSIY